MVNKGFTLGQLGRFEESVDVYDQVVVDFGADPAPAVREQTAKTLVNKGLALGQLRRSNNGVRVYDQVVAEFGTDSHAAIQKLVAAARAMKASIQAGASETGGPE